MTHFDRIEDLFFAARRSVFMISFLCFIGTAISLAGLNALDPALGIVIPVIAIMVLTIFTLMFLLLSFRLFQPINEIVKMTNKLYDDVMRDELGVELVGTAAEKERLKEMTKQVKDLKKEIAVLKKGQVSSEKEQVSPAKGRDVFWPILVMKWAAGVALVCALMFIVPSLLNMPFAIVGVAGITIIALATAHNEGRLKWPSTLNRGDEE